MMPGYISHYDVFISYRRDGGGEAARLMYDHLSKDGYTVSFDMDTLKNGNFNDELLRRVQQCRNFIILLNKGCFDRTLAGCKRENDWLRLELATALFNNKNIIAVMLPGFEFPPKLPKDIDEIRFKNGPKYDLYYLDSFYDRLKRDFLVTGTDSEETKEMEQRLENAVDLTPKAYNDSLDDIIGDDSDYWGEDAENAYRSLARTLPFEELQKIDNAWNEAETAHANGDHKSASKKYMELLELLTKVRPSPNQFVLRLKADNIALEKADWFAKALDRAQKGDVSYQYGVGTLYAEGIGVPRDASAAFRWFEHAAAQGHVKAMAEVGIAYTTGNGVEVDYAASLNYLNQAIEAGDDKSMERLGFLHENGFAVEQDLGKALALYQQAAEKGNAEAMVSLGRMLESGTGVAKDSAKSLDWYRSAASLGHPVAQRKIAEVLFGDKNCVEGLKFARLAASKDDSDAIALLGRAYEEGWGVESDKNKAEELYRKAVAKGSATGKTFLANLEAEVQYRNGMNCFEGKGCEQDFTQARLWFSKAAQQGNAAAMEELGFLYERGLGGEYDITMAKEWYEKAAAKGYAPAMAALGKLYFRGNDIIEQDYAKSLEWFKKAAGQWRTTNAENLWKVMSAFHFLGRIYSEGLGVDKNVMLGLRCYQVAAQNNFIPSCYFLTDIYKKGDGVPVSPGIASKWSGKTTAIIGENAVDFRDDQTMNTVGIMFTSGKGVKKNIPNGIEWYAKAAKLGNRLAISNLGERYLKGQGVGKDVEQAVTLLTSGVERGSVVCKCKLAQACYYGKDIAQDHGQAFQLLISAVHSLKSFSNLSYAMDLLHRMYRDGDGVAADENEARKWLDAAMEMKNGNAMAAMGEYYENGKFGLSMDLNKAFEWYKQAADQCTRGKYELGRCHLLGIGTSHNLGSALEWLLKAMNNSDNDNVDSEDYYERYDEKALETLAQIYYANNDFDGNENRCNEADSKNNAIILLRLGREYRNGKALDKNIPKAVECLRAATRRKNRDASEALLAMARNYETGSDGMQTNPSKAFALYDFVAQCEFEGGKYHAGRCCLKGIGTDIDLLKALKFLASCKSARLEIKQTYGNQAVALLAELYYGNGKFAENEQRFRKLDEKLNNEALHRLARCYSFGIGIEKDGSRALECYTLLAERGDALAQTNLGWAYYCGEWIDKDPAKAYKWIKAAVDKGRTYAMGTLFRMYRDGFGVEKNEAEALRWLKASVEGSPSNVFSQNELGECYEYGKLGLEKNPQMAFMWYKKASEANYNDARVGGLYNMGRCLLYGIGVQADATKALECLIAAQSSQDNSLHYDIKALNLLAEIYREGKYIAKDEELADKWLEISQQRLNVINNK